MSFVQKYFRQIQELHRDHLARQWEHLRVVRIFHLQCMHNARNPELRKKYRDIASPLEQAIYRYDELLAELQPK